LIDDAILNACAITKEEQKQKWVNHYNEARRAVGWGPGALFLSKKNFSISSKKELKGKVESS